MKSPIGDRDPCICCHGNGHTFPSSTWFTSHLYLRGVASQPKRQILPAPFTSSSVSFLPCCPQCSRSHMELHWSGVDCLYRSWDSITTLVPKSGSPAWGVRILLLWCYYKLLKILFQIRMSLFVNTPPPKPVWLLSQHHNHNFCHLVWITIANSFILNCDSSLFFLLIRIIFLVLKKHVLSHHRPLAPDEMYQNFRHVLCIPCKHKISTCNCIEKLQIFFFEYISYTIYIHFYIK